MNSGIYIIRNLINGKCYVGKTQGNIKKRVMEHLNGYSPGCRAIHNAIKKYGIENFAWEILYTGIIPEVLSDFERQAIQEYNTKAPHGYNLTDGGEGTLNPSKETIRKRSEKMRGENHHFFGKKRSPEVR